MPRKHNRRIFFSPVTFSPLLSIHDFTVFGSALQNSAIGLQASKTPFDPLGNLLRKHLAKCSKHSSKCPRKTSGVSTTVVSTTRPFPFISLFPHILLSRIFSRNNEFRITSKYYHNNNNVSSFLHIFYNKKHRFESDAFCF